MRKAFTCLVFLCMAFKSSGGINLALNQPVIYDPAFEGIWYEQNVPANINDGDYFTSWTYISRGPGYLLHVDLGEIYNIGHITLTMTNKESRQGAGLNSWINNKYLTYSVYHSTEIDHGNTSGAHELIAEGLIYDTETIEGSTAHIYTDVFARYISVNITGGTHWAHLHEIAVHEVPEPASLVILAFGGLLVRRRK